LLKKRIEGLRDRYSHFMIEVLTKMLEYNVKERNTFENIYKYMKAYEEQSLQKKDVTPKVSDNTSPDSPKRIKTVGFYDINGRCSFGQFGGFESSPDMKMWRFKSTSEIVGKDHPLIINF